MTAKPIYSRPYKRNPERYPLPLTAEYRGFFFSLQSKPIITIIHVARGVRLKAPMVIIGAKSYTTDAMVSPLPTLTYAETHLTP